jgi:hypothetical protein
LIFKDKRLRFVVPSAGMLVLAMAIGCGGGATYNPAKIVGNSTSGGGPTGSAAGIYFAQVTPALINQGKVRSRQGSVGQVDVFFTKPDGSGGKQLTTTGTDKFFILPSPDDTRVLYSDNGKEYVANADFSNPVALDPVGGGIRQAHWSADSSTIVVSTGSEGEQDVDTFTKAGTLINSIGDDPDGYDCGLSSDGSTTYVHQSFRIIAYHGTTNAGQVVTSTSNSNLNRFDVSPDGKKIAYVFTTSPVSNGVASNNTTTLAILDLTSSTTKTTPLPGSVDDLNWSPDSNKVAVISEGTNATGIDAIVANLSANTAQTMYRYGYEGTFGGPYAPSVAFTSDSADLLTSDTFFDGSTVADYASHEFLVLVDPSGNTKTLNASGVGLTYPVGVSSAAVGSVLPNLSLTGVQSTAGSATQLTNGGGLPGTGSGVANPLIRKGAKR